MRQQLLGTGRNNLITLFLQLKHFSNGVANGVLYRGSNGYSGSPNANLE